MSILDKVEAWFKSEATPIEQKLTAFEHTLLQKFHPLFAQIEANGEAQLVSVAESALAGAMAGVATGQPIGAAIAAAAPVALKALEADANADAKNAVYGVLAATAASLPAPVVPAA